MRSRSASRAFWTLLLGLSLGAAPRASAGDEEPYGRSGFYLGAGGMANIYVGGSSTEVTGGGELLAGYRFGRYFATDLDLQVAKHDIVRVVGQAKLFSFAEYPVQPYLLIGLGSFIWTGGSAAEAIGLFRPGLGIDFYLTEYVLFSPVVYYEFWFDSNDVEFPELVNVGATLQLRF